MILGLVYDFFRKPQFFFCNEWCVELIQEYLELANAVSRIISDHFACPSNETGDPIVIQSLFWKKIHSKNSEIGWKIPRHPSPEKFPRLVVVVSLCRPIIHIVHFVVVEWCRKMAVQTMSWLTAIAIPQELIYSKFAAISSKSLTKSDRISQE